MIKTEKAVGIITAFPGNRVQLTRFHASERLSPFVEHYWMVRWELEGHPPFVSRMLPHPSVHLVFEKSCVGIVGVQEGRFSRTLEGNGHVFGVKFRPGGFFPFLRTPVSALTNKSTQAADLFGEAVNALKEKIIAAEAEEKVSLAENFLLACSPEPYRDMEPLQQLFGRIVADRNVTNVDRLAALAGTSVRRLQRLFSQYIGVSPKWVIRRYRLHDALERLKAGEEGSLAALAAALGYADQAHFIRDFKKLVGQTPGDYKSWRSV